MANIGDPGLKTRGEEQITSTRKEYEGIVSGPRQAATALDPFLNQQARRSPTGAECAPWRVADDGVLRLLDPDVPRRGERHPVEFVRSVEHLAAVDVDGHVAEFRVDRVHEPDVAVVDVLVVVVLDLHDLVADGEGRPEPHHRLGRPRVEHALQFEIQRPRPERAAVHRAQHLHVAHGVQAEPLRNALGDDLDDLRHLLLGGLDLDDVEVRRRVGATASSGISPRFTRWALTVMRLAAAWRKPSVRG